MSQIRLIKLLIAILCIFLLFGCTPEETLPTQASLPELEPLATLIPTATEPPRIDPDTPTPTLSKTPTAAPSTTPTAATLKSERLFMFFSAIGFYYTSVDALTEDYNVISAINIGVSEPIPGTATELAFANYTNQVAIWVREPDEIGRLWLADIALQEATLIFEDTEQLFSTDDNFPPQDVSIEWFPNDQYVLVTPKNQAVEPLLVNVSTLTYERPWLWACDTVVTSSRSQELALLCTQDSQQLGIEWNGETWLAEDETDYTVKLQGITAMSQWSLSGDRFAYVSEAFPNILEIISSSSESLSVELDVDKLYVETIRWTSNGQVLISGYKEESPTSWLLVDSASGQVVWSLAATQEFFDRIEDRLYTGEITLSGNYLALQTYRIEVPAGNEIYLIDIKNNIYEGVFVSTGRGSTKFAWMR